MDSPIDLDCWEFPHLKFPKKVKVLNRKYCRLYPQRDNKKLKKLEPCFDHCKTLYTKCDYILEECAQEQILFLEDLFRSHNILVNTEIALQGTLIDRLWVLSQRYLLLVHGGVCVKIYPEIVSGPTEYRILCEFQLKLKQLNISNDRMTKSLANIRKALTELDRRCKQLDTTVESPFIQGSPHLRPLAYVREMIADLFRYFNIMLCKLKCWAQLIDPGDAGANEDYMALVKSLQNGEGSLQINIEKCTCRKTNQRDCINIHEIC